MIPLVSPMRNIYKNVQNYGLESDLMNLIHVPCSQLYRSCKTKVVKAVLQFEKNIGWPGVDCIHRWNTTHSQ